MKIKPLLFALMIIGATVYVFCRKADLKTAGQCKPVTESVFFAEHPPGNSLVKSIAQFVKAVREATPVASVQSILV